MDKVLEERERLISELCPWADANFVIDPWWVRTWPYDQETLPGSNVYFDVQFTNHGGKAARAEAQPVAPEGWQCEFDVAADVAPKSDGSIRIGLTIPEDAPPGRYTVPVRVTWDRRYLGQYRHAIVEVAKK